MEQFRLKDKDDITRIFGFLINLDLSDTWIVKISKALATRRNRANRYYWGVVLETISKEFGDTKDRLHEYFKKKYLAVIECDILGEPFEFIPSTAKLPSKEFYQYVEKIRNFASLDLELYVQDPGENYENYYLEEK